MEALRDCIIGYRPVSLVPNRFGGRCGRTVISADYISAILNWVCPECGGPMGGRSKEFLCRSRCGRDWRSVWEISCVAPTRTKTLKAGPSLARLPHPAIDSTQLCLQTRCLIPEKTRTAITESAPLVPIVLAMSKKGTKKQRHPHVSLQFHQVRNRAESLEFAVRSCAAD